MSEICIAVLKGHAMKKAEKQKQNNLWLQRFIQSREVSVNILSLPETHTKRQATQHDYLPSLLGDGAKRIKKVYGEEKKYFVLGPLD